MRTSNQVRKDHTSKPDKIQNKSKNPPVMPGGITRLDFERFVERGRILYTMVGTGLYAKDARALLLLAQLCTIPVSEFCRCAIMDHMRGVFSKLEWTAENDKNEDKRKWANDLCKKIKPNMPKQRYWDKNKGWIPVANPKAKRIAKVLFLSEYLAMKLEKLEKKGVAK